MKQAPINIKNKRATFDYELEIGRASCRERV